MKSQRLLAEHLIEHSPRILPSEALPEGHFGSPRFAKASPLTPVSDEVLD